MISIQTIPQSSIEKNSQSDLMSNIFNRDFRDFIEALNEAEVEYILVGWYAVIFHGYNRTTGDLDIWVKPASINYQKLRKAFSIFGMSVFDMSEEKFLDTDKNDVFSFGNPPVHIEILTKVKDLDLDLTLKKVIMQQLMA
mgnify:CR=1 FL=1